MAHIDGTSIKSCTEHNGTTEPEMRAHYILLTMVNDGGMEGRELCEARPLQRTADILLGEGAGTHLLRARCVCERVIWWNALRSASLSRFPSLVLSSRVSGLRAKLLYALYPADGNFFKTIDGDPICLFLYFLRLVPFYGISILVFLLTFFLIDKSDEFQL